MSANKNNSVEVREFEPFLRECLNYEDLQLVDLVAKKMLPLGENYSSLIIKIDATIRKTRDAKEETLHLVAKTPSELDLKISEWSSILKPEVFMYAEIVPVYNKIDESVNLEIMQFYPKYIGHRYSLNNSEDYFNEHSMLLLENLVSLGYYVGNKSVGLDAEHAKVALSSLARFHALGMVLKKIRPDLIEKRSKLSLGQKVDFTMLDNGFDTILKAIRENDSFKPNLQVIESIFEASKNGRVWLKACNELWGTMIHADFWTNNMLFRKNEDNCVDDVKFVDFQGSHYNSGLKDLPRFLCISLDENTQTNHMNELIDFYYNNFKKWIERYGCSPKPYTREEYDQELQRQAIDEFPLITLCLKLLDVSDDDKEKTETFASDMFAKEVNDQVVGKLQFVVNIYEEKKWFR